MNATEALQALTDALTPLVDTDGIRLHPYGVPVQPPATVVAPPKLDWQAYCDTPTEAQFTVYLVAPFDERAVERLLAMLPVVHAAVESVDGAAVAVAQPTTYGYGQTTTLPAYMLPVSFALS